MDNLQNIKDLKNILQSVLHTKSQKEMAQKLKISEPTLSRILSDGQELKIGPKTENVDKIVDALAGYLEKGEDELKEEVYGIIYGEKKKEYLEKSRDVSRQGEKEKPEVNSKDPAGAVKLQEESSRNEECEDMLPESEDLVKNKKTQLEEKIKERLDEMMAFIGYDMEEKYSDWGDSAAVLYETKLQHRVPYTGHQICKVLGIGLTEENYMEVIYRVIGLDKEDGLIILYCEQINVLDKVWKDTSLKVKNNVLLCDLSSRAKLYVKSLKKGEKGFLKFLFGKNNLIFSKS